MSIVTHIMHSVKIILIVTHGKRAVLKIIIPLCAVLIETEFVVLMLTHVALKVSNLSILKMKY
jgi:hypothetical protein